MAPFTVALLACVAAGLLLASGCVRTRGGPPAPLQPGSALVEAADLTIAEPQPQAAVTSPLRVAGQVRGLGKRDIVIQLVRPDGGLPLATARLPAIDGQFETELSFSAVSTQAAVVEALVVDRQTGAVHQRYSVHVRVEQ